MVSGKGVQANSVQCTVCKKWIHKRCSGVRGDLSREADGFRYSRCDGTAQEADISEDLMVNGETYGFVNSFCYLGDTLDENGGADFAATVALTVLSHSHYGYCKSFCRVDYVIPYV